MKNLKEDNITGRNNSGKASNKPLKRLTVSSIIGDNVFNVEGELLGQIKDMMIDMYSGAIEYVVIEFGGFIGINQKYFAVAFQDLSVDAKHRHAFVLNETRKSLNQQQGFDKRHWPGTNSHLPPTGFFSYGGFVGANTGAEY